MCNVNYFLGFPSFLILVGLALSVLLGCMIFLSPFLAFIKICDVNCFARFPSFLILAGLALNVLIGYMIFLSPFLDVIKMCNVHCFFHRTATHWNSLPAESFPLTFDLSSK